MKRNFLKGLAVLSIAGIVSGCALVPGMTLNVPASVKQGQSAGEALDPLIVAITPSVIQDFSADLHPYLYHIGVGDVLSVVVWNHPEFAPAGQLGMTSNSVPSLASLPSSSTQATSTNYTVNPDGTIFFPMLGYVQVQGLTSIQVMNLFTQKLAKYIKNPQVTVQLATANSQKVYVMGALNQGQNPTALLTITDQVPMTLAYAVSQLGGINQSTANTRQIYVIRGSADSNKPVIYWLNAESPAAMIYADAFPLQNHDIVFVSMAAIVQWNIVLSQILPTVQTIWFTKSLVNP